MRRAICLSPLLVLTVLSCSSAVVHNDGPESPAFESPSDVVRAAVSPDARLAAAARKYLRDQGEAGLATLRLGFAANVSAALGEGPATAATPEQTERILAAFDAVSGQRDGWASGFYWHTDMPAARAAARDSGRPILNLWLLGRLDDEFC